MKIESFSFGVDEYAGTLTNQTHQTLYWLNRNGYLDNEVTEELLARVVVAPIRNRPTWGQRVLARFFDQDSNQDSYVFPIALLEEPTETDPPQREKPTLEVVK